MSLPSRGSADVSASQRRFVAVALPAIAIAAVLLIGAAVWDAPGLAVAAVGFIALAASARFAFLRGDWPMAILTLAFFVAGVGFGIANAV
jgi:hypothetical protein